MKVIVFGATGGTGRATLRALASAGHQATGFARNPASLSPIDSICTVSGDVMNATDVAGAVPGHDAVIVSLGNSQNPFSLLLGARRTTPRDVCEVGTRHIIAAMQASAIRRLLVVTAFGIGDNRPHLPFSFKLLYWTLLREHMADKEKQESLVRASPLSWTLVQPVGLTDASASGIWLADTGGKIRRNQIPRADVAAFMVACLERDLYERATVALSGYRGPCRLPLDRCHYVYGCVLSESGE